MKLSNYPSAPFELSKKSIVLSDIGVLVSLGQFLPDPSVWYLSRAGRKLTSVDKERLTPFRFATAIAEIASMVDGVDDLYLCVRFKIMLKMGCEHVLALSMAGTVVVVLCGTAFLARRGALERA